MQILLTLDKKDYEEGMPVFEKYSTRGVIIRDGKIATQHGSAGDYKILGGGVEPGEKLEDALIREVGEESGLIVIPESIRPIGEIVERRRDLFEKNKIYVCHSCFFFCSAKSFCSCSNFLRSAKSCWRSCSCFFFSSCRSRKDFIWSGQPHRRLSMGTNHFVRRSHGVSGIGNLLKCLWKKRFSPHSFYKQFT